VVSIIENRAKIEGIVKSVSHKKGPGEYTQVEIDLKKAVNVGKFPNLAKADVGSPVVVRIKKEQAADLDLEPGSRFSCPVQKAFGQVYYLHEA
jgi:hypothetical protein